MEPPREPSEARAAVAEAPPLGERPPRSGRSRRGGRRRRRGGGNRDQGMMGGQSGGELSNDAQTVFDADTGGQQEMGWTGTVVEPRSTPRPSDSPMQAAPGPGGAPAGAPAHAQTPVRTVEAPATPAPASASSPERSPPALEPERPHVVWSSSPAIHGDPGSEGPRRDE